eukprot:GHRR01004216.1.p2 GENE.GHRR01004216.1~~GHRR01004216.1.p2  ORF type:complete len:346 (+),score=112.74 GHRR01004216.1:4945-5982(+)
MVLQLLDLVLLALTFFIGVLVARGLANSHYQKQLQQEKANWSAEQQLDSPATVLEGLTLGWLNLLLQALWPPVLEKHVANLTANLLQRILDEVLSKNMHKAPWKYINSILVEELSFGQVPPSFQAAVAKYDPGASMLSFSMDVHYRSSGAQAVMLVKSRSFGVLAPLSVRLEATHVQLKGRLHLGLLLGPEPPGIKGIYYSFTHPPDLDIAVRPLGMPLPPGLSRLTGALRGVLSNIINKRIVEPERRFFDLHQMYLDKHIAREGLVVCCRSSFNGPKTLYYHQQQPLKIHQQQQQLLLALLHQAVYHPAHLLGIQSGNQQQQLPQVQTAAVTVARSMPVTVRCR